MRNDFRPFTGSLTGPADITNKRYLEQGSLNAILKLECRIGVQHTRQKLSQNSRSRGKEKQKQEQKERVDYIIPQKYLFCLSHHVRSVFPHLPYVGLGYVIFLGQQDVSRSMNCACTFGLFLSFRHGHEKMRIKEV